MFAILWRERPRKSCTGSAICSLGFDTLTAELLRVIQEAMQPQSVSVWLKEPTPPAGHNLKGKNPIDSGRM